MTDGAPRVYDLSTAHPDGWFEEVLAQSNDFEKACEIIGRSTLGLALIAGARIKATPEVIVADDFPETLRVTSGPAAAVILGFEPPAEGDDEAFVARMGGLMEGLGTTIVVWSAGGMQLEA